MRNETEFNASLTKAGFTIFVVLCLLVVGGCNSIKRDEKTGTTEPAKTSSPPTSDLQKQQQEVEQQFRPEIETQRQQNENEVKPTLDQEAIPAVGLRQTKRTTPWLRSSVLQGKLTFFLRGTLRRRSSPSV